MILAGESLRIDRFSPIASLSLKSYALALIVVVEVVVFDEVVFEEKEEEDFLDIERSKVAAAAPEFEDVVKDADFTDNELFDVDVVLEFSFDTLTDDDDIEEDETEIDDVCDLLLLVIMVVLLFLLRLRSLAMATFDEIVVEF